MLSFVYNSETKDFPLTENILNELSSYFKLDLSSIKLRNKKDGTLHVIEDQKFVPEIAENEEYEVFGDILSNEIVSSHASEDMTMIPYNVNNTFYEVVEYVQNNCEIFDENEDLLLYAPQTVLLVEHLFVASAGLKDVSLVTPELPIEKFIYLKNPHSLHTCLYEISCSISDAFDKAHSTITNIGRKINGIPNDFEEILEITKNANSDLSKNQCKKIIQRSIKNSEYCRELSKNTYDEFQKVINLVKETLSATISNRAHQDERIKVLHEEENYTQELKNAKEVQRLALEEAKERSKAITEQLFAQYEKEATETLKYIGTMFALSFTDCLSEVTLVAAAAKFATTSVPSQLLNALPSMCKSVLNSKSEELQTNAIINIAASISTSYLGLRRFLQYLEKKVCDEEKLNDLKTELTKDIETFAKHAAYLSPIRAEFQETLQNLVFFIEENIKKPIEQWDKQKISELKVEINNILAKLDEEKNLTQILEEKAGNKKEQTNFGEKERLIEQGMKRMESRKDAFEKSRAEDNRLAEKLEEAQIKIAEMTAKLKNINLNLMDMEQVMETLRESIRILSEIQSVWWRLRFFFDNVHEMIEGPINDNIEKIADLYETGCDDPRMRMLVFKSMLRTLGICIYVTNASKMYRQVSLKYIMPAINGVAAKLVMSKEEAFLEISEIDNKMSRIKEEVKKIYGTYKDQTIRDLKLMIEHKGGNMLKALKE